MLDSSLRHIRERPWSDPDPATLAVSGCNHRPVSPMPRTGPSREELLACAGRTVEPVIAPGLRVLFCGINPGLYTAWAGHHFARPGNRFWPALHRSGFTPRQLAPAEQQELLGLGLGVTNVVERATATAAELTAAELREGGQHLEARPSGSPRRTSPCSASRPIAPRSASPRRRWGSRSGGSARRGCGCCPTRAG